MRNLTIVLSVTLAEYQDPATQTYLKQLATEGDPLAAATDTALVAAAPVPPTASAVVEPVGDTDLDVNGLPWDERIHARTKTQDARGAWKYVRGLDKNNPGLKEQVEAELHAAFAPDGGGAEISFPLAPEVAPPAVVVAPPVPAAAAVAPVAVAPVATPVVAPPVAGVPQVPVAVPAAPEVVTLQALQATVTQRCAQNPAFMHEVNAMLAAVKADSFEALEAGGQPVLDYVSENLEIKWLALTAS